MSADVFHFTPDVHEILREIAADPDASLLRIEPVAASRENERSNDFVRPTATLLTRAERELVRAHRAVLVAALRSAYTMKLYAGPEVERSLSLVRIVSATQRVEVPVHSRWSESARAELGASRGVPELEDGLALLQRCVSSLDWPSVTLPQLVAAAQRLAPSDHARIVAGIGLMHEDDTTAAMHCFEQVLEGQPRRIDAAFAHINLARAHEQRGDLMRAIEASRRASSLDESLHPPHVNECFYELVAGNSLRAVEVSKTVDDRLHPDDAAMIEYCTAIQGAFRSQPQIYRSIDNFTLRSVADRCGPATRSLVHAMLRD